MEITKNILQKLYIVEEKSTREIGLALEVSQTHVSRLLKKHGIKARAFSTKGLQTRLGAVLSDETKKRMGRGQKGKKLPSGHRAKVIKTLNHGKGVKNNNWKGGRIKRSDGYVMICKPNHHRVTTTGYVFEHILVMEKHLGRKIEKGEIIHHLNRKKDDNRIENLILFPNQSVHIKRERKKHLWSTKTTSK